MDRIIESPVDYPFTLNPLETAKHIEESYFRYILTTFPLKNRTLRQEFETELRRYGKLIKGPLLEATPQFKKGKSIRELVDEGILHDQFLRLSPEALPIDRPLYLHQEISIRKAIGGRRNLVIATGTGSGKTESFLIPIMDCLFKQRERDGILTPGVRALLLYPMNALANDQLKRLRKNLAPFPEITFGRYIGETKATDKEAQEQYLQQFPDDPIHPNELLSRNSMRSSPPHILLTNFAMLEYLLLRPQDSELFADDGESFWKFIVMDEAHVYNGAMGIEISMLLRRLKERVVQSKQAVLQCFATSATLGRGMADYPLITSFASNLFGEKFEAVPEDEGRQDVVEAKLVELDGKTSSTWGCGECEFYREISKILDEYKHNESQELTVISPPLSGIESILDRFSIPEEVKKRALMKIQADPGNNYHGFLYEILKGDGNIIRLQKLIESGPKDPIALAESLWGEGTDPELLLDLVNLGVQAREGADDQPLLPARYHLFVKALEGVFICLKEEALEEEGRPVAIHRLFLNRQVGWMIKGKTYSVFELSSCKRCGQEYLIGMLTRVSKREKNGTISSDFLRFKHLSFDMIQQSHGEKAYFLFDSHLKAEDEERNEDEDVESGFLYEMKGNLQEYLLCISCGVISTEANEQNFACECPAPERELRRVYRVKSHESKLKRCPMCGGESKYEDMAARFLTGQDAPISVLATALYQKIPPSKKEREREFWGGGRKLLVFSDSRQDAAFFAPYLEKTYIQFLARMLMMGALLEKTTSSHYRLDSLVSAIYTMLEKRDFFPYEYDKHKKRSEIYKWIMAEFISFERRISLEGMGLIQFQLAFPPEWKAPEYFKRSPWNLSDNEIACLYQALLNTMRIGSIVKFPDEVKPTDELFAPRNYEFFIRGDGSDVGRHVFSWLSAEHSSNRRYDYLFKILKKSSTNNGTNARKEVTEALRSIWEKDITHPNSPWMRHKILISDKPRGMNVGVVFQLNCHFWQAIPTIHKEASESTTYISTEAKSYRCPKCSNVTSLNIRGVCPTYRCDGSLEPFDILSDIQRENNHYRHLYLNLLPISMKVHEHTAQLENKFAAEIQNDFIIGKLNVLSCSTTFELGVDLGELQTVLFRNVPPETANYVQRAGRAGRRTDSAAFIITFAQRRSHDLSHFREPERMVGGKIRPPAIELSNPKIMRRHLHSMVFSYLFRLNPNSFGSVGNFFFKTDSQNTGMDTLAQILSSSPDSLKQSLMRVIPSEFHGELELENWGWQNYLQNDLLDAIKRGFSNFTIDFTTRPKNTFHDRELVITREGGEKSLIFIGRGLDFIEYRLVNKKKNPMTRSTSIIVLN